MNSSRRQRRDHIGDRSESGISIVAGASQKNASVCQLAVDKSTRYGICTYILRLPSVGADQASG